MFSLKTPLLILTSLSRPSSQANYFGLVVHVAVECCVLIECMFYSGNNLAHCGLSADLVLQFTIRCY